MRDKYIWVFNSGIAFDGNPKWLFLYIINYHKEIKPYWFCYTQETVDYIRKLGYQAFLFKSNKAEKIGNIAGVYVVNQNKEIFQTYFKGITILNLWHGVGCKAIEKNVKSGFLNERIVKKNILNKEIYKKYQLFLVTSPLMEKHFKEQCDIDDDKLIRAGYPCCLYPGTVSTYNYDILAEKRLSPNTKIAVYAPTYRDSSATNFLAKAIPDIEQLITTLEKTNFLLIFKLHPLMSNDFHYQNIKKQYKDCPRLLFWDNANDLYEIFDQIELAIVDYSSIFYDMLAKGVKNFARYIFDYGTENTLRDFALDYMEMTYGKVCNSYADFLNIFSVYKDDIQERDRIYKLFWSYSDEKSLERIVNRALQFKPDETIKLPILYSFDIFDTLIGRCTLEPQGVFRYVKEKISESPLTYPTYLKDNYYKIRPWAEANVREYFKKNKKLRENNITEITFDLIFERIKELYNLTDEQISNLKKWELECEYQSSIPYISNIQILKELLNRNETVVLISDMYLPKEFIRKLLKKADPILSTVPLFLSSDYRTQKTTKVLFFDVYHALDYKFGRWIHYGDNPKADGTIPQQLGIETINHTVPRFNRYERQLVNFINSYDSYQISALFSRFRQTQPPLEDIYAYCYVSLYWVPYISWVIRHAIKQGLDCLYFISRDGYHLKRIADTIIKEKHLNIETRYIYGSRKAWRIPSQIYGIDEEFFGEFGNFADVTNYEMLLKAAVLTEREFAKMFPELVYLKDDGQISSPTLSKIRETLCASKTYREYLLEEARRQRKSVIHYLKQEINFTQKFAFVEFWGRGYTQTCLARLLWEADGKESQNIFYYARSIYPSEGNIIRYNFTANTYSMIFIESIFANLPYRSIASYKKEHGKIIPVMQPCKNNMALHHALERLLPQFSKDFANLKLVDIQAAEHSLFDFALSYFHNNQSDEIFAQTTATLYDSVAIYGSVAEYAPPITLKAIIRWLNGEHFNTKNFKLSLARSSWLLRKAYSIYYSRIDGTRFIIILNQLRHKRKE